VITSFATSQHVLILASFNLAYLFVFSLSSPCSFCYVLMLLVLCTLCLGSRDSAVGIATGCGLDDGWVGVRVPVGSRIFYSPRRPDRLWGPPSLLSNGYRGLSGREVKLTTHLKVVPRSRKCESVHPLPHTPSWRSA
jgi:hypothetical protein